MSRRLALVGVCLVATLAGCSTSPGKDGDTAVLPAPVAAEVDRGEVASSGGAPDRAAVPEAVVPAPAAGTGSRTVLPRSALNRQVVRDATLELQVDNVAEATERARLIGSDHGGFVATEEFAAGAASLTLRVASTELDAALTALGELGEVTSRTLGTQDVTEETVDLAARIGSQRASVERVRALLDRAVTIGEIVQVESELTWRQAELESLQQRAATLADQVALATVRVRLEGPEVASAAAGGFGSGLAGGWDALRSAGRVVLIALGAVLPFAAVLALPMTAVLLWYRRRRQAATTGG